MKHAVICDAIRTPFGRYGGSLSSVRTDDLAALPLKALIGRNRGVDWEAADEVILGNANQAGEDNRNVARMSLLLAGLPVSVPGVTVNRLCASGMEAIGQAARAIMCGEANLVLAGGVESMSRAPFVMAKANAAFSRDAQMHDTTIGWRFVNPAMKALYGVHGMPETAENVADEFGVSRADQDQFALRSHEKAASAQRRGVLAEEIVPVEIATRTEIITVADDEHPRTTTFDALANLKPITRPEGTVTAGNSSGVNDGACAVIVASADTAQTMGLVPKARVLGMASAAVPPRIMGVGPVPAVTKLLHRLKIRLDDVGVIELNEAFAAQALAVLRQLGLSDDDPRVNRHGGAIALGHPLGASGARLVATATYELQRTGQRYALCTLCVGVGQGLALMLERL